jgi:hypothetical protein
MYRCKGNLSNHLRKCNQQLSITSGFDTPEAFQPQEAIISGNKLGSMHINMLHTLSQNILVNSTLKISSLLTHVFFTRYCVQCS